MSPDLDVGKGTNPLFCCCCCCLEELSGVRRLARRDFCCFCGFSHWFWLLWMGRSVPRIRCALEVLRSEYPTFSWLSMASDRKRLFRLEVRSGTCTGACSRGAIVGIGIQFLIKVVWWANAIMNRLEIELVQCTGVVEFKYFFS